MYGMKRNRQPTGSSKGGRVQSRSGPWTVVPRPRMSVPYRQLRPGVLSSHAPELKSIDLADTTVPCTTAGTLVCLNLVVAGSSFFNRIGRKIEMKSVQLRAKFNPTGTANPEPQYSRVMIVYDRQTNGAVPSLSDIIQSTTFDGTNSTSAFSGQNLNNRDRFVVVHDRRVVLPPVVAGGAGIQPFLSEFYQDFYRKLPNLVCQYKADSSPTPVIGDIATGALWLVVLSELAAGVDTWDFEFSTRVRYVDL